MHKHNATKQRLSGKRRVEAAYRNLKRGLEQRIHVDVALLSPNSFSQWKLDLACMLRDYRFTLEHQFRYKASQGLSLRHALGTKLRIGRPSRSLADHGQVLAEFDQALQDLVELRQKSDANIERILKALSVTLEQLPKAG